VKNPSHYQLFPDQDAIDIIRKALTPDEFRGYCKGNALKYRLRVGDKDAVEQDIAKSNTYRDLLKGIHPSGRELTACLGSLRAKLLDPTPMKYKAVL